MSGFFREVDDTRLVHYEGCARCREYMHVTDMESRMYAKPQDIVEYLENDPQRPYISCEYMHCMGNSGGGLKLYTDLEEKYAMYQGGFIWDYIDQSIYRTNDQGERVLCYGGDHDERATDYEFCGNRMGIRWLSVQDGSGAGLKFTAEEKPFEGSVLPYSAYELDCAMHREELPRPHYTWVRIMGCQMGVGGDDSWGAPVQRQFWLDSDVERKLVFTIEKL